MHIMHSNDLDLNLLRVFDAVYRLRNVSRAAESIGLTQPAASHALTRLRLLLGDPLFVRKGSGVAPTARAVQLSTAVTGALAMLSAALNEPDAFDPLQSRRRFRLHMSDIAEARFLPKIMAALKHRAPGVSIDALPLPQQDISAALNQGSIDFAFGYLPAVQDTEKMVLLTESYVILLRVGHPFLARTPLKQGRRLLTNLDDLQQLDYAVVRSHSETLRLLELLGLQDRLKLVASHFLALPDTVRHTDLAVLMPKIIAEQFVAADNGVMVEPDFPNKDFLVSLHWSAQSGASPAHQWFRKMVTEELIG